MKRMKFTALVLALITLVSLVLTSCHGRKGLDPFVMPESFDETKQYNITFWAKNESNATQRSVYEDAIEAFESIYPNINVTIKHYSDYGIIYNDVITNIQTLTTPNVCITYPDHIATYMTGENIVIPLDDIASNEKYGLGGSEVKFDSVSKEEIVEEFVDECYIDSELYALPFMRSTEACYINETFVKSLGYDEIPEVITWDFMFEVANKAMSLGKKTVTNEKGEEIEVYVANGQTVLKPIIYKSTDNMMIQMLRQLDAEYSTDEGEIKIFNDTTKELLYKIKENVETGSFSTFKIDSYPGNFLNKGQCIFAIDSTAGATWMGSDAPLMDIHESNIARFETAVRPVPQFDTENPAMISQGPSLCVFNKTDPGEVVASWLFAQFLLTDEVQISYAKTEGYVPVTESARENKEYTDYLSRRGEDNDIHYSVKIDTVKMLNENISNTFTTPVFNGSASLRDAAGQMIEEVTKAIQRNKTVDDEFISKTFSNMISLYRLDQLGDNSKEIGEERKIAPLAIGLIVVLVIIWLGIGSYYIWNYLRKKKTKKS